MDGEKPPKSVFCIRIHGITATQTSLALHIVHAIVWLEVCLFALTARFWHNFVRLTGTTRVFLYNHTSARFESLWSHICGAFVLLY